MARKRVKRKDCPNCGRSLLAEDNFCPACGQENHTHKLPIAHFLVELLTGLFNFDTKVVRTLRDLFWPPGLVIREFNANKRIRYVHPLRLYLFTSVLFFLALAWSAQRIEEGSGPVVVVNAEDAGDHAENGLTLQLANGVTITDSTITALSASPKLTDTLIDSTLIAAGAVPNTLGRILLRGSVGLSGNSYRKAEFVQRMLANFSKLMFLLLPLFAILLKFLFWRAGYFYSEHLVFALYFHTVIHLILGLDVLFGMVPWLPSFGSIPFILLVMYLFWALRTVYGTGWARAFLTCVTLILTYAGLLAVAFLAALVIGALAP